MIWLWLLEYCLFAFIFLWNVGPWGIANWDFIYFITLFIIRNICFFLTVGQLKIYNLILAALFFEFGAQKEIKLSLWEGFFLLLKIWYYLISTHPIYFLNKLFAKTSFFQNQRLTGKPNNLITFQLSSSFNPTIFKIVLSQFLHSYLFLSIRLVEIADEKRILILINWDLWFCAIQINVLCVKLIKLLFWVNFVVDLVISLKGFSIVKLNTATYSVTPVWKEILLTPNKCCMRWHLSNLTIILFLWLVFLFKLLA